MTNIPYPPHRFRNDFENPGNLLTIEDVQLVAENEAALKAFFEKYNKKKAPEKYFLEPAFQ